MCDEPTMKDYRDLEFLSSKSASFIEKQVASYRQKHSNSGSIITVAALFIPFFLGGLEDSLMLIKYLSIIPVAVLICAIVLLISVLRTKSLDQGFHVDKFSELCNDTYENILLYEIGANKSSFIDNKEIIDRVTRRYNIAIKLTVIAIISSALLLFANKFFKPDKEDKIIKVQLINSDSMKPDNENEKSNGGGNKDNPKIEVKRDIPYVPPKDRTNLNEGAMPKDDGSKKDKS